MIVNPDVVDVYASLKNKTHQNESKTTYWKPKQY